MSLSRPVKFPFLKLPWLCIKCVLHNLDELVIIYFATISNRTLRIVRSSNYPIKEIDVGVSRRIRIIIIDQLENEDNDKTWFFQHDEDADGESILQMGSQPFGTYRHFDARSGHHLYSYTVGDTLEALKTGIDFMIEVFGCTVRQVFISGHRLSELFGLGISSVKELFIGDRKPVNVTGLKYLLENVKVTDEYVFYAPIPANFSCDPQIFKCRKLYFSPRSSADWVTLKILCQFDVAQLYFSDHRFSFEDIVSYINHWFNSENRKLEYLHIHFDIPFSLEDFQIDHLNPMPFSEKRRSKCPLFGRWEGTDMSDGKDILRQDGLLATLYAFPTSIVFHVWHKRFPDAVEHIQANFQLQKGIL